MKSVFYLFILLLLLLLLLFYLFFFVVVVEVGRGTWLIDGEKLMIVYLLQRIQ